MRCIEVTGSDDRMDRLDFEEPPVNELPKKCPACGFPDLEHVPEPYLLLDGRSKSPHELAEAENGNLLVRERIVRVLQILLPNQCDFYPTQTRHSRESTSWFLVVPRQQVVIARVDPAIPRCAVCHEPASAHPGSQYSEWLFGEQQRGTWSAETEYDILKSQTWSSCTTGWHKELSRFVFLSLRLLFLLKEIGAKGLYEATCGKPLQPDATEQAWIRQQLQRLTDAGIDLQPQGIISKDDAKWFRSFLADREAKPVNRQLVAQIQKKLGMPLPPSYLKYLACQTPMTFEQVDDSPRLTVRIHPLEQLDLDNYRGEAMALEDEESSKINGVAFASSQFGDGWCFDAQPGVSEYRVFQYHHESLYFELYAANFAACVRRFLR